MEALPRGRIKNDAAFEMADVVGQKVEEFVGHLCSQSVELEIDILLLKVVENQFWYRFFLDAGCGFWEEWAKGDAGCDWDDVPMVDLATKWKLRGARVTEAKCVGAWEQADCSEFQFGFDTRKFVLRYSAPNDMESPTIFEQAKG